jgi:hypothetical protein
MMIQYLVGLCCLRRDPQAIEIMVGDMIFDEAAEKERDVDVTVTIVDEYGGVTAFKAAEVKHEGKPLDVTTVEQLIAKLMDMPEVTHMAIFSTSGYTDGARSKARRRGVDLYTLQRWESAIGKDFPDFHGVGAPGDFLSCFRSNLLFWRNFQCAYTSSDLRHSLALDLADRMLDKNGKPHARWSILKDYQRDLLIRSTGILCTHETARAAYGEFPYRLHFERNDYQFGHELPFSHVMNVVENGVYVKSQGRELASIDEVSISGFLQWRRQVIPPEFMILKSALNDSVFAGAAIADIGAGDGRMFAMIFPEKGCQVGIHNFQIPEKQHNMIRKLRIGANSYDSEVRISKRSS